MIRYLRFLLFMICTITATALMEKDPAIGRAVDKEIVRLKKELRETRSIFDDDEED